ncbi:MAG: hypothetical protein RJQ01_08150 [Microcella sp.]|uniref:hypothetical protein n=1 Tax=Microcella sp. TaxID=1913979 RepID=UPI003315266D
MKTHTHPLSAAGRALISFAASGLRIRHLTSPSWTANVGVAGGRTGLTESLTQAAELAGATDEGSTVQPSFVARYIIRAA